MSLMKSDRTKAPKSDRIVGYSITRIFGLGLPFLHCWPSRGPKWTSDFGFSESVRCTTSATRDHG